MLKSGWSEVESEWVWMNKPEAHLSMPLKPGFSGTITVDVAAFLPKPDSTQTAQIYLNNKPVREVHFSVALNRQSVAFDVNNIEGSVVDMKLIDNTLVSPKSAGLSNDDRTLGVGLYGLKVQPK
jgi:hypothetical protein